MECHYCILPPLIIYDICEKYHCSYNFIPIIFWWPIIEYQIYLLLSGWSLVKAFLLNKLISPIHYLVNGHISVCQSIDYYINCLKKKSVLPHCILMMPQKLPQWIVAWIHLNITAALKNPRSPRTECGCDYRSIKGSSHGGVWPVFIEIISSQYKPSAP